MTEGTHRTDHVISALNDDARNVPAVTMGWGQKTVNI